MALSREEKKQIREEESKRLEVDRERERVRKEMVAAQKAKERGRGCLGCLLVIVILVVVIPIMNGSPGRARSSPSVLPPPNSQPSPRQTDLKPAQRPTTGISLAAVQSVFQEAGLTIEIEPSSPANGRPRVFGKVPNDPLATLEFIGDVNDLDSITALTSLAKGELVTNLKSWGTLGGVLRACAPTWGGRNQWLLDSVKGMNDSADRDFAAEHVEGRVSFRISYYPKQGMWLLIVKPKSE